MTGRRPFAALALLALQVALMRAPASAHAAPIKVVVPDSDNLQYMAFWIADGAGFFRAEGIEIETIAPAAPPGTAALVHEGRASVFVLPPPVYIALMGDRYPLYLVANLLQNDPINLVVRRSVMEARKIDARAPIADRLRGLAGVRVGVAPGPPTRLRALFAAYGLDADKDIAMTIVRGPEQNAAFARGDVDALYAHTPYVEEALLAEDAVMLVDQSRGEVPTLALRQIHALAVTRELADRNHDLVQGLVRAVARAEALIHLDERAAVDAVMRVFPRMQRDHVAAIVHIYEPAIPATPKVSADAIAGALALYPASKTPPDLSKIDRREYVAPAFADALARSTSAPKRSRFVPLAVAIALGVLAALVYARRRAQTAAR